MGYLYCDGKGHSNSPTIQSLSNLPHEDYVHEQSSGGCQEITDIPDDYLNQSQVWLSKWLIQQLIGLVINN